MYMHHPQTRRVKELVENGKLGKLQMIKGAFTFVLRREGDVRLKPELGGGSIWDVGCYPISYARLLAGAEPEEGFWLADLVRERRGHELCRTNAVSRGVLAQFDCGFQTPGRA